MEIEKLIEKVVRLRIFYDRNLFTDSMRGNVIILSSVIDALLVFIIKNETSLRKDALNSLRKGKDAYNTFSKAIDTSLLLDMIKEPTAKGLHLLRKLRNDLAHGVELMGNDSEVSQRISQISEVLKSVPHDEPKWVLHGVAIKLLHGICYDYAESRGTSRDEILAKWGPIRQRILEGNIQPPH
ncbi:uncharacterized protein Dvar_56510 [Desulfosarcina variabilis str. Montpellier]|uniref:hypothetical protein n=1 Tax=Desulfosarcina variabilis TaxID=2300 RepID=UPI003AFA8349